VKERPILFSAPMVRALLSGQKTQTRRAIKEVVKIAFFNFLTPCPYGAPGDRLWVREAWRLPLSLDKENAKTIREKSLAAGYETPWAPVQYEADLARVNWDLSTSVGRYRHARFMPRWASRIVLEIDTIRVQKLQDITENDAMAEGTQEPSVAALIGGGDVTERRVFSRLWAKINGVESWEANPWVYAITFHRVEAP
jgi:hypothetical protein